MQFRTWCPCVFSRKDGHIEAVGAVHSLGLRSGVVKEEVMAHTIQEYRSPVSLRDLVDVLGSDRFGRMVADLPGAMMVKPKGNERWRYAFAGCVVLGFVSSAVITGKGMTQIRAVEILIRTRVQEVVEGPMRVRVAVRAARTFIEHAIIAPSTAETAEAAVALLVGCWLELNTAEQAQAYAQLERFLPNPRLRCFAVQTVRAVVAAYEQGATNATIGEMPSGTVVRDTRSRIITATVDVLHTCVGIRHE